MTSNNEWPDISGAETPSEHRMRHETAILWAFTAMRLLRAAGSEGEAWVPEFIGRVNRELKNCVVDSDRLDKFVEDESKKMSNLMKME